MMKALGGILMALGALVAVASFFWDTTVSAGAFGGGQTHNIGLLQTQLMVLHSGLAMFVAGAFLFGAGEISQAGAGASANSVHDLEEEDRQLNNVQAGLLVVGAVLLAILAVMYL